MHIVNQTCELAEQTIHDVRAGIVLSFEAMENGEFELVIQTECVPGGERTFVFTGDGKLKGIRSPLTPVRLSA